MLAAVVVLAITSGAIGQSCPENYPFGEDGNEFHWAGYDGKPGDWDENTGPDGGDGGNAYLALAVGGKGGNGATVSWTNNGIVMRGGHGGRGGDGDSGGAGGHGGHSDNVGRSLDSTTGGSGGMGGGRRTSRAVRVVAAVMVVGGPATIRVWVGRAGMVGRVAMLKRPTPRLATAALEAAVGTTRLPQPVPPDQADTVATLGILGTCRHTVATAVRVGAEGMVDVAIGLTKGPQVAQAAMVGTALMLAMLPLETVAMVRPAVQVGSAVKAASAGLTALPASTARRGKTSGAPHREESESDAPRARSEVTYCSRDGGCRCRLRVD